MLPVLTRRPWGSAYPEGSGSCHLGGCHVPEDLTPEVVRAAGGDLRGIPPLVRREQEGGSPERTGLSHL